MNPPTRTPIWVLVFALCFPTLVTWIYFVWLAKASPATAQTAYVLCKIVQFGFPLGWLVLVEREKPRITRPSRMGVGWGLGFGVLVGAAMLLLYFAVLQPAGVFDAAKTAAQAKVKKLGIDSLVVYAAVGLFYALIHSFLEEYYWRWFVFARCRQWMGLAAAVLVSSLGFMAHHVLVLSQYFGWDSPVTYLFSLGVALGGGVWALIYHFSKSLYGPWWSHLIVDAAIFAVGYDVIWG